MKKQHALRMDRELAAGISVLFLFGVLAGFLLLKVMSLLVKGTELQVDENYLARLLAQKPDFDLYLYTVWQKLKGVLLFLLLALTWLDLPYMGWLAFKQGFLLGYLLTSILPRYQIRGLLLIAGYYFPQVLFRIPLWLCCFSIGWRIYGHHKDTKTDPDANINLHKINLLHLDGKRVMLLMILCFAESAAETWFGTILLQKAIQFLP